MSSTTSPSSPAASDVSAQTRALAQQAHWFFGPPLRSDLLSADHPPEPLFPRLPRWLSGILRFVLLVLLIALAMVLIGLAASVFGFTDAMARPGVTGTLVNLLGIVPAYVLSCWLLDKRWPPLEYALRRLLGLPVGLLIGAVLLAVVVGLVALLGGFRITGTNPSAPWLTSMLVLGIGPGFFEETLFRGIVFRWVEWGLGTWGAMLLSGGIFGIVHLSNSQATLWGAIAIAIEAGLLFGALYALTRSLWVVAGLHWAWNWMQGAVFGINVSGSGMGSGIFVSEPAGHDLISGGAFGVEASLVAVVLLSLVCAWCVREVLHRDLAVAPVWTRSRRLREGG